MRSIEIFSNFILIPTLIYGFNQTPCGSLSSVFTNCNANSHDDYRLFCECARCPHLKISVQCAVSKADGSEQGEWRSDNPELEQDCRNCQEDRCWSYFNDTEVICGLQDELRKDHSPGDNKYCNCRSNCLPVKLKCQQNGFTKSWRKQDGTCSIKTFKAAHFMGLGEGLELSSSTEGYIDSFQCLPGYKLQETTRVSQVAKCENGKLNVSFPHCEPLRCPSTPNNLKCPPITNAKLGESISCMCPTNCMPVSVTCTSYSTKVLSWDYNQSLCIDDSDYENRTISYFGENVRVSYSRGTYIFSCISDYLLQGASIAICKDQGIKVHPPDASYPPRCNFEYGFKILYVWIAIAVFGSLLFITICVALTVTFCCRSRRGKMTVSSTVATSAACDITETNHENNFHNEEFTTEHAETHQYVNLWNL